ncbi:LAMI_0G00914g1_1 [Lachancea mirantina]|uniref:UDP-N-acetylglucosamine transferase subunit ALG14 n=1 Tax=Lachancea mirantina TaxID=1230905 RepID=A0A1G4K7A1_9SACH|nr:LAMI_0G00914g1_1 [Lachancea mirantina]
MAVNAAVLVWLALLVVAQTLVVRAVLVVPIFRREDGKGEKTEAAAATAAAAAAAEPCGAQKVFVFLGSGGHTGEMLRILELYRDTLLGTGSHVVVGYSDQASRQRFESFSRASLEHPHAEYVRFRKAREVGSGKLRALCTVFASTLQSVFTLTKLHATLVGGPHLVLLNGPGTCCIIAYWLRFLDVVTWSRSNILYIESLARIRTLSLTGKLLYPVVDEFVVQWRELAQKHRRARWYGIIV